MRENCSFKHEDAQLEQNKTFTANLSSNKITLMSQGLFVFFCCLFVVCLFAFSFNTQMILIVIVNCVRFPQTCLPTIRQKQSNVKLPKSPSCRKFHFPSPSVFLYHKITSKSLCVCISPESAVCKSHVITSINHSPLANTSVDDPEILLIGIILQEITYCWLTVAAKYFIKRSENPKFSKQFPSVASGAESIYAPLSICHKALGNWVAGRTLRAIQCHEYIQPLMATTFQYSLSFPKEC